MADQARELQQQVQQAFAAGTPLRIQGGNSKSFYGFPCEGQSIDVSTHSGIVAYEPSELFITARAGTPLAEVEAVLGQQGQMLPFEPPHFGAATIGGTVASGLSGPRRPFAGAVRDAVLGLHCINGRGEVLQFGGQVVKNVAGYDVSRLMCGALGTLAVLLDVSIKVIPKPAAETTVVQELGAAQAITKMNEWAAQPLGLSAACYDDGKLYCRFTGDEVSAEIGGEVLQQADSFWSGLREQTSAFFQQQQNLWRLSLPPATVPLSLPGACLIDWGGAQRWLFTDSPAAEVRSVCEPVHGHATLFRAADGEQRDFQSLDAAMLKLHQRVKQSFDPGNILNRGRLFADVQAR